MLKIRRQQGFSLVEMLVVFAIMGTVMVSSIAGFSSYNRNQSFRNSVSEVAHALQLARSRALSEVKPTQCGALPLRAYQVVISPPSTYRIEVLCETTVSVLQTHRLAANVTFPGSTSTTIRFAVATGTSAQNQSITLNGYGNTKAITISQTGIISVP